MSNSSPLRGPATVNLRADDVAAAADWYAAYLGVAPYFIRPEAPEPPAYVEFRIGDDATELGIVSSAYLPGAPGDPGAGQHVLWHVDDLEGEFDRLVARGARVVQPVVDRGAGFATAVLADPFGNALGLMRNPHYEEVREASSRR